jgi:hypothetical protein
MHYGILNNRNGKSKKVTGFALALDDQHPHISIFARADTQHSR